MSDPVVVSRLALAQAKAQAARARLSGTIGQLQERAKPTSLVHDVAETLKDRGGDFALGLVNTAKARPARAGAVLALAGLFFARHRVVRMVRSATGVRTQRPPSKSPKGNPKS